MTAFDIYARDFIEAARWRTVKHTLSNRGFVNQITRVCDNPPLDAHAELLRDLSKREKVDTLVVDAKELFGPWMPVAAWIEESPSADGTQAVHPKLYQALRLVGDDCDTFVALDGCLRKQTMVYVYDSESVEDVSGQSLSGVEVELQGIRRDDESGLYTYVKVITEAVEKDVGSFSAHIDKYSEQKRVTRLNQREEATFDADGKPVGTKTFDALAKEIADHHDLATQTGGGVVVDVQVDKNSDCTANVSVINTIEQHTPGAMVQIDKTVRHTKTTTTNENAPVTAHVTPANGNVNKYEITPGGLMRETTVVVAPSAVDSTKIAKETITERSETQVSENQPTGSVAATAPNNGVLIEGRQDLNDDGTWNVSTTTTTELPLEKAIVVKTKTSRNLQTQTLDQHQAADFADEPVVGSSQRMERSQGGLYNLTTTTNTPTKIAAGDGDTTCKKTVFEHEHTTLAENQPDITRDVTNAGSGKTYERVVHLNDDGTFQIQDKETEEITVEKAVVDTNATATATIDRVVNANATAPLEDVVGVGPNHETYQRRSQLTPGGRYETTETRVRPITRVFYYNCAEAYNGQQQQCCIFYNQTPEQVKTIAEAFTNLSLRLNDHDLYDGNAYLITPPYKSGNAYEKEFDTFDQTSYGMSDRTVISDGKLYTVLTFYQKRFGIVYDSDIVQNSANNPYNRVQGYKDWYVNRVGKRNDGYYEYGGVRWSREIWYNQDGVVAFKGKSVGTRDSSIPLPPGEDWTEAIV